MLHRLTTSHQRLVLAVLAGAAVLIGGPSTKLPVHASAGSIEPLEAQAGQGWQLMPGSASDIGIGANGAVWIIGANRGAGDNDILWHNGDGWVQVEGQGVRIAVTPQGQPWIVNAANEIYERTQDGWVRRPGTATDVGVGADGTVWKIGTDGADGGYGISRWTGSDWAQVEGAGTRIAVDPRGEPWVANVYGNIYRRGGQDWAQVPGGASDLSIGADGSVWIVGKNAVEGGYGIWRLQAHGWDQIEGGGGAIAVDPSGAPWIVNAAGAIYRRF